MAATLACHTVVLMPKFCTETYSLVIIYQILGCNSPILLIFLSKLTILSSSLLFKPDDTE